MKPLFLDHWIAERISKGSSSELSRETLEQYQLSKLNETLSLLREKSSYCREKLTGFPHALSSLKELELLPFTTTEELRESGYEMLCVSSGQISRIVSLDTSGSTGEPKRLYFTEEDQELTIDYFHHGMQNLVESSDVVLILLPCKTPGSVGDLLATGLHRLGCQTYDYGFPNLSDLDTLDHLARIIKDHSITSMVGSPKEVLALARHSIWPANTAIRTVLLSTDYISEELTKELTELWGCQVFEHYGMTEMGLGGAVSCETLVGYHPRENDLYFELVDPETGDIVPDGEYGEVVFTTLTRKGMPLLRYRTGDLSRWIPGSCPCGSVLKRLDKVLPRGTEKYHYLQQKAGKESNNG